MGKYFNRSTIAGVNVCDVGTPHQVPGRKLQEKSIGDTRVELRVTPEGYFIANWLVGDRHRYVSSVTLKGVFADAQKVVLDVDKRTWGLYIYLHPRDTVPGESYRDQIEVFWALGALTSPKTLYVEAVYDDKTKTWRRGDPLRRCPFYRYSSRRGGGMIADRKNVIPFNREIYDRYKEICQDIRNGRKLLHGLWKKDPVAFLQNVGRVGYDLIPSTKRFKTLELNTKKVLDPQILQGRRVIKKVATKAVKKTAKRKPAIQPPQKAPKKRKGR